jgi:hypothetical protein
MNVLSLSKFVSYSLTYFFHLPSPPHPPSPPHTHSPLTSLALPGFASFVYIVGFVLLFTAAIMVSPVCCGTPNETTIMRNPQEIEEFDPGNYTVIR